MLVRMSAVSLPARIVYAAVALPAGGAAGFYCCMWLAPALDPSLDGLWIFNVATFVGAVVGFTAFLFALTLPWSRHRKRRGRPWRIGIACLLVVVASAGFATEGHKLVSDLVFAAWLTYTLAYTFVRYGVLDQARRTSSSSQEY